MVTRKNFIPLIAFVSLALTVVATQAWAQTGSCYLAEHNDVICPRNVPYTPPPSGIADIPGGNDPSPGPNVMNPDDPSIFYIPPYTPTAGGVAGSGKSSNSGSGSGCGSGGSASAGSVTGSEGTVGASGTCGNCTLSDQGGVGQCNGIDALQNAANRISKDEGCRNYCYGDVNGSATQKTCGVGHELVGGDGLGSSNVCTANNSSCGVLISNEKVCSLFQSDLSKFFNKAKSEAASAKICDPCFIAALANANFQLGDYPTKFPAAWANIKAGNFKAAISETIPSAWYNGKGGGRRTQELTAAIDALLPVPQTCANSGTATPSSSGNSTSTSTSGSSGSGDPASSTTSSSGSAGCSSGSGSGSGTGTGVADPKGDLGKSVGDGQCVALVKDETGLGATSTWSRGDQVQGNTSIQPGTAIATFDSNGTYGNHTDGSSHAAIYQGQNDQGIQVIDQWVNADGTKHVAAERTIKWNNPGDKGANTGTSFYVVK